MIAAIEQATPGANTGYCLPPLVIGEVYRITGDPTWLDVAERAANVVLSSPFGIPRFVMPARIGLGLVGMARGDLALVEEQYRVLESTKGTFVLPMDWGSVDRRLGLFSHTMGNLDQASAHFEDALVFCRKSGYRPELAWTCCDYADTLLQRDNGGDRAKATSLLDEALAISSELGMRPLMEQVLSRREILKA